MRVATAFADLPHIDETDYLDASDEACMLEVREVLLKHGKTGRLGVTLLHRHFDLAENERLIEHCDEDNRTFVIKPEKIEDLGDAKIIETAWQFSEETEKPISILDCVGTPVSDDDKTQTTMHYTNIKC
jgi:hypothetical protein